MEITARNVKKWSTIGARPTFGMALLELAKEDSELMALTADVSTSAGLERYKKMLPEQFIDAGIAEQNMMGIAAGLAKEGHCVVTTTFAPFQSMRCLEQIRVNLGYMGLPLVMVGLASGIYHCYLGNTHCCFEDAAILRSIPNIAVVTPADGAAIVKTLEGAVNYGKSVYIRLIEGKNLPVVYGEDFLFSIGKANILKEGKDVAILANGTMVSRSLEAANILQEKGITCKVVDFHTIKPLDTEILDSIAGYELIVTVEEHNVIGGLGSAVAEYMIQKKEKPRQILLGIQDFYPHFSEYEEALKECGLTAPQIAETIWKEIGR